MVRTSDVSIWLKLVVLSLAGFLFACGGGGGGGTPASTDTTIAGSVVAAPVSGASVVVKDTGGNTIAGPVKTGADGTYSVVVPNAALTGELVFESTGGTFEDEATLFQGTAGLLAAYVPADGLSSGNGVHLTPASTIVQDLMHNHGKTHVEAQALIKNAFGFEVDTSIAPVDVTNPPAGAGQDRMLAGLRAAVFSQLTMDLDLTVGVATEQFDLLPALARDIADGTFDGEDTGGVVAITDAKELPADVQNRFSHALAFMHGETKGKTGLTNDQIGSLPFARLAKTATYTVEYIPAKIMMNEVVGKTKFTLRITNDLGGPLPDTVTLMPKMHMATMNHATPNEGCMPVTGVPGDFDCSLYYLMASSMMDGMSMGFWELKVMIGGEEAIFYPDVKMAMGDTARAVLKGQADEIMGMEGMMPRSYYLFNDGIKMMGTTFNLFIAAQENMMSFPGVSVGTTLKSDDGLADMPVDPMLVQVCATDPTVDACWVDAVNDIAVDGVGHWSASSIIDFVDTLYVRVIINSEQKTVDGLTLGSENGYATFKFSAM